MSKHYSINIPAHNSIYINDYEENNYSNRELLVNYSEPDEINEQTGILLLIPGYGAHISSNVYKKMRETFSEQYNLIVLQCNYFGSEFMQTLEFKALLNIIQNSSYKIDPSNNIWEVTAHMNENEMNLNDMGLMQAIDNITAVLAIIHRILEQGIAFNTKKIIIYGHSHGAYLSYMCNRLCPQLFQLIIDNSAYTYPAYIDSPRTVSRKISEFIININYYYLITKKIEEVTGRSLYSLKNLYNDFNNSCYIISFHGTNDSFISIDEKYQFTKNINKMVFMPISDDDIDGTVFRSCDHGLDCDFLKLFDMTYKSFQSKFLEDEDFILPKALELKLNNGKCLFINYDKIYPRIYIK